MAAKSPSPPSIERIAELQQLVANFAKVLRVPHLADTGRPENDVEHSYGLALTCWFLAPKIAPELDLQKIICCALAHDLVEIMPAILQPLAQSSTSRLSLSEKLLQLSACDQSGLILPS